MKKETFAVKIKITTADCKPYEKEVTIPYMTNTRAIEEGELIAVKKVTEKRKRDA